MSALLLLSQIMASGRTPHPFLVEEACSEAIEKGRIDIAIAISDAWPSTYDEGPQPTEAPDGDSPEVPPEESEDSPHMPSPLKGVSEEAWNDFVSAMKTEDPSFSTEKYLGAFRYRKERFAELGVTGTTYDDQYEAFKRDMVSQYTQGRAKILIDKYAGLPLKGDEQTIITSSGILALVKAAGPRAETWIVDTDTRTKYPGTTSLFNRANGIF